MGLKIFQEEKPWYSDGLNFECTQCGQCCTGAPGYVWISHSEMQAIAQFLNITIQEFSQKYLRRIDKRFSLKEHPVSYDCIFLKNKKCQIYPVRPKQCRTFPWWPENLYSEKSWKKAANACEGIRPDAPRVPFEKIKESMSE
jgi:Fe-S-cluster containining protein